MREEGEGSRSAECFTAAVRLTTLLTRRVTADVIWNALFIHIAFALLSLK